MITFRKHNELTGQMEMENSLEPDQLASSMKKPADLVLNWFKKRQHQCSTGVPLILSVERFIMEKQILKGTIPRKHVYRRQYMPYKLLQLNKIQILRR